jgi:gamma-glutamylcysteine synthetase
VARWCGLHTDLETADAALDEMPSVLLGDDQFMRRPGPELRHDLILVNQDATDIAGGG